MPKMMAANNMPVRQGNTESIAKLKEEREEKQNDF
jgi:hypothetical protein